LPALAAPETPIPAPRWKDKRFAEGKQASGLRGRTGKDWAADSRQPRSRRLAGRQRYLPGET